ncbi:hypothetical protein ACLOJK_020449 [Asimina triloba]
MGGGGAMRNVSKFTGFASVTGFRQLPPAAAEQAARKSAKPIPALASAQAGDVLFHSGAGQVEEASVQRPSWELNDWEFAGDDVVDLSDFSDPPARVVFEAAPTMEEAREATSDLRDALDSFGSSPAALEGSISRALPSEHLETKACVSSESVAIFPSVPKPVLNAFYLLKESPDVQNVVASLAADKNVWDAVMKNEKVMEFYQSQQSSCVLPLNAEATAEFFSEHGSDEKNYENMGDGFMRFIGNVKLRVANMVSNLSEFLQNIFGNPGEQQDTATDDRKGGFKFFEKKGAAPFFMLGILAIMVVLLKRK